MSVPASAHTASVLSAPKRRNHRNPYTVATALPTGNELVSACDAKDSLTSGRPRRDEVARLEQLVLHGGETEIGGDLGGEGRRHPPPIERLEDVGEARQLGPLRREHPQRDGDEGEAHDDAERPARPCAGTPRPRRRGETGSGHSGASVPAAVAAVRARPACPRRPARPRRTTTRYPGQASASLFQDSCSVSGMTRVSHRRS